MKIRHLFAIASSAFALNASAQVVSETFDFNGPSFDQDYLWRGSEGWSTTQAGSYFIIHGGSGDGTKFVGFDSTGSGWGATASRAFSAPTTNQQFSIDFSVYSGTYWGTQVGIGSTALSGLEMRVWQYGQQEVVLTVAGSTIASGAVTFSTWTDYKADINLGANSGTGSISFFTRETGTNDWSAITGLSNIDLGLDATRTAGDDTNPLNWDTLWFHHEGGTSGIDNLSVTAASAIPEPSTYAAMAGAAALGLAIWRRRSKVQAA